MIDLLKALLLGVIEGITEFLPISSTGHLLIAERWLGHRSDLFNIGIQAGAILAVVLIYRQRLWDLAMGFFGHSAPAGHDPAGMALSSAQARTYTLKLSVAFGVTAVLGVLVKKLGFELPEEVTPIAWALILGAVWMVVAEYFAAKRAQALGERSEISWTIAVLVGIAQVVAGVFPGTSRSAATIFVALLAGTTNRAAATEFAFLVGIPTMFAATGYELIDVLRSGQAANEDWTAFAVAFVASAVTAFIAVKWLLSYIQSHRFTTFAVYRLILGVVLLLLVPAGTLADTTALSAYHWRLNEARDASGKRIETLFVNADKPLQLDFAEGRISVSNTCNRMGGAYSVEGGKLKFDRLASTLMACTDANLMALDQEIGKRLEAESAFALQPGDAPTLTLTSGNGDTLTFKGEPTAETRYGDPGETAFLEVAAQTKPCSHPLIPDMRCLQVREIRYDAQGVKTGTDGEFQNFYGNIEGYDHEPGIRNVLRVKRYTIKNPPADGSSLAYELDMVVESETVKK